MGVTRTSSVVVAGGELGVEGTDSCVAGEVTARVRERYAPAGGTDADEDAYPLTGDELDLEPLARDAVLLDLPLAPLCSDGCLGLCPQCGANWNEGPCACPPSTDPRWSALDALRDA